jgi:hypothetical protein
MLNSAMGMKCSRLIKENGAERMQCLVDFSWGFCSLWHCEVEWNFPFFITVRDRFQNALRVFPLGRCASK